MTRKMSAMAVTLLAVLSCSSLCFASARVTAVSGIVRAFAAGSDLAQDVSVGQILPEGTEVRTTANGMVTLEFDAGNTVRIRSNGRIVLAEPRPRETRIKLLAGQMKGIFSRLTGGRKFAVEYPSGAVCAVKGCETVNGVEDGGKELANILFGAGVILAGGKETLIPQGCGAVFGEAINLMIGTLNEAQIVDGLADWTADQLPSEQGEGGVQAAGDSRKESREAIAAVLEDMADQIAQAQEQTNLIREEDFAAGRTLKDVHGNLTRVDQRIDRPFPNTIQFLNLVKRDSYVYRGKFDYDGPGGARLDYAEMWVEMNQALPDSLLDWPKFISDSTEDLKPNLVRMTLANGSFGEVNDGLCDSLVQTLDFVDPAGRRYVDESGDDDPQEMLVLTGAKCAAMPTGSMTIVRAEEFVDGQPVFEAQSDYQRDGDATDDLWTTNSELFVHDVGTAGCGVEDRYEHMVFFNMEMYVINNDGKILNAQSDFANSNYDPFTVLKNTAVEGILSVTDAGMGPNSVIGPRGDSVLKRGNFDLVVTPDIVLMAVEKVAAVLGDIDTGSSGSGI